MKLAEIEALAEGLAPVIRDLMAAAVRPLVEANAELQRQIEELRAVDHTETMRAAIAAIPAPDLSHLATKEALDGVAREFQLSDKMTDDAFKLIEDLAKTVAAVPAPPELPDIPALIADAVAALPVPKDGESVTLEQVEPLVAKAVAALPPAEPGKSVTLDDVSPLIDDAVARAVAALPPAEPGKDGAPGKLPLVKEWSDEVHHEGDVVTLDGAAYQAQRDTGKAPPHDDWICIAAAGKPGKDADEISVESTYDPNRAYKRLSIVALNGAAFISRKDGPGECPGADWQVIAMRGKPGEPGKKGDPGPKVKGDPGPSVAAMHIDGEGLLSLVNADGSTIQCDLYPVLAKVMN